KTQVYVALPKAQKKLQIIFSVIGGLLIWLFLSELFGYGPGIPQFSNDFSVGVSEIIWFFPIVILSVLYGLEFEIFDKITGKLSGFIENKRFIFAVIAGLILGLSGTFVPMVMYSGEEPMRELINNSALYSAFGLLIIAAFKIPLINICIKFGWRGGIFFPAIFCGVCLGFAFAAVVPCNAVFCCAVATAALVSTITHMPFIVAALLMICFPANCFVWILGTSCLVTVLPDFVKDGKTDIKGVVLLIKLKQKVQNKINHFRDV
ncbi:MAG: chloride channel protein, partial [Bacillota bacterium]